MIYWGSQQFLGMGCIVARKTNVIIRCLNCAKEPQSLADSYNIDVLSGDKVGWLCVRALDGAVREEQIWRAAVVVTDANKVKAWQPRNTSQHREIHNTLIFLDLVGATLAVDGIIEITVLKSLQICKVVNKYGMVNVLDHRIHYTSSACRRDTISYIRYSLLFFPFSFIFLKAWLIWGSGGALKNPDQHAFHHCHLISHPEDAVNQSFSLQQHCDRTKTLMENYSCCCGAAELWSCLHCVGDVIEFTTLSSRLGLRSLYRCQ